MELAQQWLEAQRGTPSFLAGAGGAPAGASESFGVVDADAVLNAPLPRGLLSATPSRVSPGRSRTPRSAVPAHRRVHEELIAKGKLYEQRREALQERARRQQLKQLRAPKISQEARDLHHDKPFHERVARQASLRKEQKDANVAKIKKDDDEKLRQMHTFKPKLSNRGKRATSKVYMMMADQHDQWQARREEAMEAERAKRVVEELQQVRDGPEINTRSQRLAAQRREKEGLAGMSHAEAMLERDRLAKLALWERQQREAMGEYNPNPRITMYAATLGRDEGEEAHDRLYRQAFEAAERKAERARDAADAAHRSPRISATARSRSRSARVEDDLMERHLQSLAQKEQSALEADRRQRHQHTPAINPVSDAIAAQLPQSSRERLSQTKRAVPKDERSESDLQGPMSLRSVSANVTEEERAEILARQEQRRQQRMHELRAEAEAKELAECTFSPATSRRRASTPTQSLADRSTQWAKKREQWRHEQLRAKRDSETAGCTFAPETGHKAERSSTAYTPQRSIYGGDGRAWGTDEFVQRQRGARERVEEQRSRQTRTGSRWSNAPTVPEEPQLGRSQRRAHISALERPIQPPRYGSASPDRHAGERAAAQHWDPSGGARAGSELPEQAHFSDMRTGGAPPVKPLVPFTVHEHRAALGQAF